MQLLKSSFLHAKEILSQVECPVIAAEPIPLKEAVTVENNVHKATLVRRLLELPKLSREKLLL